MNKSPANELSVAMSNINLGEGEIKELKEMNVNLKQELAQIIEERNKISSEKKQMQKKVNGLSEKVIGKAPMQ